MPHVFFDKCNDEVKSIKTLSMTKRREFAAIFKLRIPLRKSLNKLTLFTRCHPQKSNPSDWFLPQFQWAQKTT